VSSKEVSRSEITRLSSGGSAELASGESVSGNYFSLLATQPALGRLIQIEDDNVRGPGVVVLSFGCWKRQFGGNRAIAGTVIIDSKAMTVQARIAGDANAMAGAVNKQVEELDPTLLIFRPRR
jgi:hypothetical protein